MYFKRKVYQKLLEWKQNYAEHYAVLLEGAKRVGKSTIAETFAKNEYKSYILLDFSKVSKRILEIFDDISDLNIFFLRLQAETGRTLFPHESIIIFDEVQLYPKAREAIKHLVKDGRYHFLETGSLISIHKNVKDILIPSEEMRIPVYPLDYEEFCLATGGNFAVLKDLNNLGKPIGESTNRSLMRKLRIYMAVGGMPQAVEAYINGFDFAYIDRVKREIIQLYEADFRKLDPSGMISSMYHCIPAQLSRKRFNLTSATGKRKNNKSLELLYDLIDSKTVLPCYRISDHGATISQSKNLDTFKLYLSDTGLFITLLFIDRPETENDIYAKLLSDKLDANLGYLYENLVACMIAGSGRELAYHTWKREGSTHDYEVDFLISDHNKIIPIEVKSSKLGKHESISLFVTKYSTYISRAYVFSQKDQGREGPLYLEPFYLLPVLLSKK